MKKSYNFKYPTVMKHILVCLLILKSCEIAAQEHSVKFLPLKFSEAVERAQKENKYIFLDAYTTWCVPCKRMEKEVFTKEKVADYLNSSFVNVKFDMEKDEGIALAKRYGVSSFPTYLIIKPDGQLLHRMIGYTPAENFLTKINNGISGEYSSENLKRRFLSGERSPSFIMLYKQVLNENYDRAGLLWLNAQLFPDQTDSQRFDSSNWAVYKTSLRSWTDTVFQYMLYNQESVSRYVPNDELVNKLKLVCFLSLFDHYTGKKKMDPQDLDQLMNHIRFIPVGFDDDINVVARAILLQDNKRYDQLLTLYEQYVGQLAINRLFWDKYLANLEMPSAELDKRVKSYLIRTAENCQPNSKKFYRELLDQYLKTH